MNKELIVIKGTFYYYILGLTEPNGASPRFLTAQHVADYIEKMFPGQVIEWRITYE